MSREGLEIMLRVLLIDDEPFILQGLSVIVDWNNEGFEIVGCASDATKALDIIEKKNPDLIITDIKMPQMSGLELIEKVRTQNLSDAYFVLLSGYNDFEYAKRALQNECLDYMLKPVDKKELLSVLEKVKSKKNSEEHIMDRMGNEISLEAQRLINSFTNFDLNDVSEDGNSWNLFDKGVDKAQLDALIKSVEINQKDEIELYAAGLYKKLQNIDGPVYNMIIHYMLFQLISLASSEDETINHQEIYQFISENAFMQVGYDDGCEHMIKLMKDYGDYLSQLRGKQGQGVLGQIEVYLKENYKENITLKDLGKKYYINAAYLGQLFKKQYGESFKDYLNKIRIEKSEKLLLNTDMKIYEIAEEIGYKDIDYFINKFIAINGCTPTKFRKKTG